jgi:hypothetical protein
MTKYNMTPNIPGKPNPIKQWRKQLKPSVTPIATVQSHATIQALENAVKTDIDDDLCKSYNDVYYVETCNGVPNSKPCATGSFHITRSANTIINKKYCSNTKQYLQSKCKTFNQNQTLGIHLSGPNYTSSCSDAKGNKCNPVIHKPNNKKFKQQGGVTSSSRIAKLKYDTIVNSTNKYDSLLANLDQSAHILNRKPVPCRGWRIRGVRPYTADCHQTSSFDNI